MDKIIDVVKEHKEELAVLGISTLAAQLLLYIQRSKKPAEESAKKLQE